MKRDLLWMLLAAGLFYGCKKDAALPATANPEPSKRTNIGLITVSKIFPETGAPFSAVTITGTGFSVVPEENSVYFYDAQVMAKVISATSTQLVVVVPPLAKTGKVHVTKGSNSIQTNVFTVKKLTKEADITLGAVPQKLAFDKTGNSNIFASDGKNLYRYKPDGSVNTLYVSMPDNVAGDVKKIYSITTITTAADGNVYFLKNEQTYQYSHEFEEWADYGNEQKLLKINPAGNITAYGGPANGKYTGAINTVRLVNVSDIATDVQGRNMYIIDHLTTRKIDQSGNVTFFADPKGKITADVADNIYVLHRSQIQKINQARVPLVFSGKLDGGAIADGSAGEAAFSRITSMAADNAGNIWVVDKPANGPAVLRLVNSAGYVSTLTLDVVPDNVAFDHNANKLYIISGKKVLRYAFK